MLTRKQRQIVFIGHEASLSGAPLLLLNLLLLLKKHEVARITVVLARGGPLLQRYQENFPVSVLKPDGYAKEGAIHKRIAGIIRNRLKLLRLILKARSADLVFSNTIVNGPLLKIVSLSRKPVVTYVHELENVIHLFIASGITGATVKHSALFAYPSLKVKEALMQECHIGQNKLYRLDYYFPVNINMINDTAARNQFVKRFKENHKLSNSNMLVGGMGLASGRKGTDIFIDVCEKVVRKDSSIKFCWIGAFEDKATEEALMATIRNKRLSSHIVFTGPLPHHYYNMAAFDVFFLSSREDPYPLVVLEAGFMRVPAICFEGSGGITEFVGTDAGWVLPGFDEDKAAETILQLKVNKTLLAEKGARAFEKSMMRHTNETLILQQFEALVTAI